MSNTIHDISDLFMYALQVHGKASFPGLGTFLVSRKPAAYAENRKKITPPETSLGLHNVYDETCNVLHFATSIGVPQATLEQYAGPLKSFLSDQSENKTSEFHLAGIGFLETIEGSIQFRPETEEKRMNAFSGWPVVMVNPLALDKNNIQFAIEQPQELIFPGKKRELQPSTSLLIPVLLISLVVLFLIIRFMVHDQLSTSYEKPILSNTLIQEKNILKETIRDFEGSEVSESKKDSVMADSKKLSASNVSSEKKAEIHENKNTIRKEPVKKIDQSETVREKTSSNGDECIYVVGAFTRKKNALNLQKQLQKRGYRAEIYSYNRFSRVGVRMPCQDDTSARFQGLQKDFPELWLLEE